MNFGKVKLNWGDHVVWLSFEAFNDLGDDPWCSRAAHGKVDQRFVLRDVSKSLRHRELFMGNQRADEIVIERQPDSGKFGRFGHQCDVSCPELEDRFIACDPEVFCRAVDRVQESISDPKVNES